MNDDTGKLQIVHITELANWPPTPEEIEEWKRHERNYRRGYYHGYIAALNDIERSYARKAPVAMWEFCDNVLRRWRAERSVKFDIGPPRFRRE